MGAQLRAASFGVPFARRSFDVTWAGSAAAVGHGLAPSKGSEPALEGPGACFGSDSDYDSEDDEDDDLSDEENVSMSASELEAIEGQIQMVKDQIAEAKSSRAAIELGLR
jgi:hypothetical protein